MPRQSEKEKLFNALLEKHALDMRMLESGDDEEEDELNENFRLNMLCLLKSRRSAHLGLPKSIDWEQNVLSNLNHERFLQMVRVTPEEFEYVLNLIKDDSIFQINNTKQLPVQLQLRIVLFRLGSSGDGQSIRKTASFFGVGDGGTIANGTKRVFKAIQNNNNKQQNFILAPQAERSRLISAIVWYAKN